MKRALILTAALIALALPMRAQVLRTENTGVDVAGQFRCSGDISPAQIIADQNDYNPTGLTNACVLRLNSDAARNITGLAGGADGRVLVVHNIGSFNIVLVDESTLSVAANRFALNANITLGVDHAATLWYDSTSSRWRAAASSVEAAPGGGAPTGASYVVIALDATLTAERNLVAGAGLGLTDGGANAAATLATASSEADFFASGALTCGAATQGSAKVHTTPFQYCDNAATPVLQYAAYGNSSGESTAAAADSVALTTDTTGNYVADVSAGAGLNKTSSAGEAQTVDLSVLSTETDFLAVTTLTCGAGTKGRMSVPSANLTVCDNSATPTLRTLVNDSRAVNTTGALTGGGDLTADRSLDVAAGGITTAKVAAVLKTRQVVFILGADNGAALVDGDDQATIYVNRLGQGITITEVWCESDAGTPSINLQRDDGTPANILSANLSCSTSGATGTIDAAEDNVADTERIDFVMVTAGGTAKRVTVAIKFTLD